MQILNASTSSGYDRTTDNPNYFLVLTQPQFWEMEISIFQNWSWTSKIINGRDAQRKDIKIFLRRGTRVDTDY